MMTFKEYVHSSISRKPKLLYHATFGKKSVESIQQNGLELKLQTPQNFHGVFFTRTKRKAYSIGRQIMWRRNLLNVPMFIITVDSSKISKLFYDSMYISGVYAIEPVPADAIISIEQVS